MAGVTGLQLRRDPPVQFVSAMDVHGVESTFRHIYRSTPRRHLLTTGWSNFVNNKKLLTGDSCRLRARRGRQLAAAGQPFEVVHYPRASASEFCVRVDAVKESMLVPCAPACSSRWRLRRRTCRGSAGSWVPSLVSRRPIPHGGHIRPGDSFGYVNKRTRTPSLPLCSFYDPFGKSWWLLLVTWDEPELLPSYGT